MENSIDFKITEGDVHDLQGADLLIKKIGKAELCVVDKGMIQIFSE